MTQLRVPPALVAVVVGGTGVLLMATVVRVAHGRSGRRALSVDLLESVMSIIVVAAPTTIIWGDDVLGARAPWFAAVYAFASVAVVFGAYWSVLLFLRPGRDRSGEGAGAIGFIAVLLASVAVVNAVAQTAQGVTGYALPPAPLLALHGLCMSLLMLAPLRARCHQPRARQPAPAGPGPGSVAAGGPHPRRPPAPAGGGRGRARRPAEGHAVLAPRPGARAGARRLRQLAASRETQRLYAEVENAAEARRDLLAALVQRIDDDRHRVAAQLHEQAVAAYASFVTVAQMSAVGGDQGSLAGASAMVRDDLRAQAEALRQPMVAVRPLEVDRPRATSLSTPIRAFVDALYRERRGPSPQVRVADDVELDRTTETLVLQIVQEAVRNVWRHARAASLDVSVRAEGPVVEVAIADDGVGFRPDELMFESGIAAMRSFAELGQGRRVIDSAPGGGTTVTARLGEGTGLRARPPGCCRRAAARPRATRARYPGCGWSTRRPARRGRDGPSVGEARRGVLARHAPRRLGVDLTGDAQLDVGEREPEHARAGGDEVVGGQARAGHERGELGRDLDPGGDGRGLDRVVVHHPRVAEQQPVGRGVLVEEAEQGGEQVLHAGAGGERHLRRLPQPLLELREEALHDADEQLRATLGEVVVEQPLRHAGRAGDLGQARLGVAGGGEDLARGRDDLGTALLGVLADPLAGGPPRCRRLCCGCGHVSDHIPARCV